MGQPVHLGRVAPRAGAGAAIPELTARALGIGLSVGFLLAVANLYMGLKTGWCESGHVTASVLGFAIAAVVARRRRLEPGESATIQSAATAVGAAPAAAGLLGAIPALALLGHAPPSWAVAALGLSLAILGILGALAVRRRLIEEERLPFPTGVATAEVVLALRARSGGSGPARTLAATAAASALVAVLRDLAGAFPAAAGLPLRILGAPASAYTLGIAWNPMLAGAGLVAGARAGLSVLGGGILAWGILAPWLVASGAVAAPEYGALVAWLAWPGVALILGAGAVSLAGQWRAFGAALRDVGRLAVPRAGSAPRGGAILLAAAAALAAAALAVRVFGMHPAQAAAALAVAALLALACVRAAAQTDILPAGEMAQVAQAALGGGAASNVAGGSLVAGTSAQMGTSLWSFRAAQLLGAAAPLQARAMIAGAFLGSALAVPVYGVLVRAHGIGSEALPAPGALTFRAVADLVTRGGAALPPGALPAAGGALLAGAALEWLGRRVRWLPSPSALGTGFLAPAFYGATICAGALAGAAWRRLHARSAEALAPSAGAGAIAGESLAGVTISALIAAGVVARR